VSTNTSSNTSTYRKPLLDNQNLLDGQERLELANLENKKCTINLFIIQLAISDVIHNSSDGKIEIDEFFIEIEEHEQAIELYNKFIDLCKNYLTLKQLDVMYKYVIQRQRLKDIALEMKVTPAAILKSIRFIAKKVKKHQINLL